MSNNVDKQMITLRSSDGVEFMVTEKVAKMSNTISSMIKDSCAEVSIPLPNITAKILAKVIEYCEKHVFEQEGITSYTALHRSTKMLESEIENWDKEFTNVDHAMIFGLIKAAHYLDIKGLRDLTCKKVAGQMANKSLDEIRNIFNIKNDYTSEEEAAVCWKYPWVSFN